MTASATSTTLYNGSKHIIIHVYATATDSTELTDTVIYDYSADAYAPSDKTKLRVEWIQVGNDGVSPLIEWDGATDFPVWGFGNNSATHGDRGVDFQSFGGIKNLATTPTGDLTLSTIGFGASEHIFLIVCIRKE